MGLIAKELSSGRRINIMDYLNPRAELKAGDLVCQLCGCQVIIKAGLIRAWHFAHKNGCSSDYESHPESPEHLFFKDRLSKEMGKEFQEYLNIPAILEYPIEEVKRIADIVFEFPNGWLVAHEIQLASITTETLAKRTEDYRNAGVDVIWWLGKSANTPANRQWLFDNFGECYTLDWDAAHNLLQ